MNIAAFKRMVAVAALAGLFAGVLLTLIQQIQVIPLILEAEHYEQAAETGNHESHAATEHGAWQPQNGWERNLATAGANIVAAVGFALLLGAAVELRGAKLDWRSGLLWGLGGYAVFFGAPSLGLPPEVPGTAAAGLAPRQMWWVATSIFTAAGLWFLAFSKRGTARILGGGLLILPHLIGAPQPEIHGSVAPAGLAHAFIVAAVIANAVFWLCLGGLLGFFQRRVN